MHDSAKNILYRIKRGLAAYVSFLAACEMNEAFSEYLLYEPVLRILMTQQFSTECEVRCPGIPYSGTGEYKKLDFVARHAESNLKFALEVKWAREGRVRIDQDLEKLQKFREANPDAFGFLCIFGKKSNVSKFSLDSQIGRERGDGVYAEFGVTRFGSRTFEIFSK